MTRGMHRVLERLREGPLPSQDWSGIAGSKEVLKVRVCQLRKLGHHIVSVPQPRLMTGPGKRPVTYVLDRGHDTDHDSRTCASAACRADARRATGAGLEPLAVNRTRAPVLQCASKQPASTGSRE